MKTSKPFYLSSQVISDANGIIHMEFRIGEVGDSEYKRAVKENRIIIESSNREEMLLHISGYNPKTEKPKRKLK